MNRLGRWLVCILVILICCGCQEPQWDKNMHRPTLTTVPATQPETEVPEEEWFRVLLRYHGKPVQENYYMLQLLRQTQAHWFDGTAWHSAAFDENGVAKIAGLDGTYQVVLSGLPEDYTYHINWHRATNDERSVEIDLFRLLVSSRGDGSGPYYPFVMELGEEGTYAIQIDGPEDLVYCRFKPGAEGYYTIESHACIALDNIDPDMEIYSNYYSDTEWRQTIEDGGYESISGFTRNFCCQVQVPADGFTFGVKATAKDGVYPILVQISVKKYEWTD